jgi:ubiquinone/menaquinone biosynthesis C-methylase UbiE
MDATFNGIWCCASLVHMDHGATRLAFMEFARVLLPGGTLFISTRYGVGDEWRDDGSGALRWYQLYSEEELKNLLDAVGFHILSSSTDPGVATGTWVNVLAKRG